MAGGTTETVWTRGNLPATEKFPVIGLDPACRTMVHRKSQSKVEVAIVQPAVPVDADLMPAHQTGNIRRVKGVLQITLTPVGTPTTIQVLPKSTEGHIVDHMQVIEMDAKAVHQFIPVCFLQRRLFSRQKGSSRIVDKIQNQSFVPGVTQPIEQSDGRNTLFIHTGTALLRYIFFKITGKGTDQLHALILQKRRHPVQAGFHQGNEIRSYLDNLACPAGSLYETAQMRMQFRRSAGNIHLLIQ